MQPEDPAPRRRRISAGPEGDTPLRRRRTRIAPEIEENGETASAATSTSKPRVRRTTAATTATASSASTPRTVVTPAVVAASEPPNPPTVTPPTASGDPAGSPCDNFLNREVRRLKIDRAWNIAMGVIALGAACMIVYITQTFESNLRPQNAAQTADFLINSRVTDALPQFKQYVKEQVPALIAQLPEYAKEQVPKYREQLENQLQSSVQDYAKQSAPELGNRLDTFLDENKVAVGQLMANSSDPQAVAALKPALKQSFYQYLETAQVNGETLQSKIDKSLQALSSVDNTLKHLAANKNLTENEKRARRAIAILMLKVDENRPQLAGIKQAAQDVVSTPTSGLLQWQSDDEAVFTAPGKPPVIFKRVSPAQPGATSSAKPSLGSAKPQKPAPAKTTQPK